MSFLSKKTPQEKLFKAIQEGKVQEVRDLLESGVDVNAKNARGTTPLDICLEIMEDIAGPTFERGGLDRKNVSKAFNTNLIWEILVRKGGAFNLYKNTFKKDVKRTLGASTLVFKAPECKIEI